MPEPTCVASATAREQIMTHSFLTGSDYTQRPRILSRQQGL